MTAVQSPIRIPHWTGGQSIVSWNQLRNVPPLPPIRSTRVRVYTRPLYTIVIRGCTGHGIRREMSRSYPPGVIGRTIHRV